MTNRQRLLALTRRQQEIVDSARNAGRSLADTEQAEFDSLQREIDSLKQEIESEERQASSGSAATDGEATAAGELTAEQRRAIIEEERSRISEIETMCRDFDIDPQSYVSTGATLEDVRAAIIEQLRNDRSPIPSRVQVTGSGEDEFRRDAADALILRGGSVRMDNPSSGARQLQGMSLRDLAIECLSREGRSTGELIRMSADEIYSEMCRQFTIPLPLSPPFWIRQSAKASWSFTTTCLPLSRHSPLRAA